jgi:hypothetical protein
MLVLVPVLVLVLLLVVQELALRVLVPEQTPELV